MLSLLLYANLACAFHRFEFLPRKGELPLEDRDRQFARAHRHRPEGNINVKWPHFLKISMIGVGRNNVADNDGPAMIKATDAVL